MRASGGKLYPGRVWVLLPLLYCWVAAAQEAPILTLARSRQPLAQRLEGWLDEIAPSLPMEDWTPGLTVAEQTTRPSVSLSDPLDTVLQYRVPVDFCPQYLPEIEPDKNNDQLCREQLLTDWQLAQGTRVNPFAEALAQTQALNEDRQTRRHKAAWLAAYCLLHREEEEVGVGAVDLLLSESDYARRDVILSAVGPPLLNRVPKTLTEVSPGEGEVALDLRVTTEFAYDSVATNEQVLLTAAQRGLGAVVIAGRTQLGDAQQAQRQAERLKREGRLPADFRVVVGQYITSRTGDVVGLFLKDRLLDGQTMAETVHEIHDQGGLAYLARPGDIGAAPALFSLPFDGYLIQTGNFELFRTLLLLDDPRLANKPALYSSNATVAFATGLPYSNVTLDPEAADPLKGGLLKRQGYAAGTLYLPWMMLLLTKPVALYQKTLNRFFQINDELALQVGRAVGADNVVLRTSWDDEMRNLISIFEAGPSIDNLLEGSSPLRRFPKLNYIEGEFGRLSLGYDRLRHEWQLTSRWRW